jgi:hypothetical protein
MNKVLTKPFEIVLIKVISKGNRGFAAINKKKQILANLVSYK